MMQHGFPLEATRNFKLYVVRKIIRLPLHLMFGYVSVHLLSSDARGSIFGDNWARHSSMSISDIIRNIFISFLKIYPVTDSDPPLPHNIL